MNSGFLSHFEEFRRYIYERPCGATNEPGGSEYSRRTYENFIEADKRNGGNGGPNAAQTGLGHPDRLPAARSGGVGAGRLLQRQPPVCGSFNLAELDTYNTTTVTQQVNTYQVELKARMQGSSTYLFDQTYSVAFTDPTLQAAVTQAESLLAGAGAVSFTGPTQLSSTQSTSSATNTVQTGKVAGQAYETVTEYVGPQTIPQGVSQPASWASFGVCQGYTPGSATPVLSLTGCSLSSTPLTLKAGAVDFDSLMVSYYTIDQTATTTNTTLTTQVYEIDGLAAGQLDSAPATPVPPSLMLGLIGIAACGLFAFRKRILRGRTNPSHAS